MNKIPKLIRSLKRVCVCAYDFRRVCCVYYIKFEISGFDPRPLPSRGHLYISFLVFQLHFFRTGTNRVHVLRMSLPSVTGLNTGEHGRTAFAQ
jgi:hypothetical protein